MAEVHRNYIGVLERGQMVPSLLVVEKIAAALRVSMAKFVAEVESLKE